MEIHSDPFVLTVEDDPAYSSGSVDNIRASGREYSFCGDYGPTSKYGISCRRTGQRTHSCILLAAAGATRVNSQSAVVLGEYCFIAIGDTLCSLSLPGLQLLWAKKVDEATCFGVYHLPDAGCLISHGELEIARVTLAGDIVWSAGGKDIFTEGFRLAGDFVETVDFNHEVYRFDIATGRPLP